MTELNPVAVYAAVVSTATAAWQVFTYFQSGARLSLRAGPNMKKMGWGDDDEDNLYVVLNVSNVGKADTTITHVLIYAYPNWLAWIRRKPTQHFIVKHVSDAFPIPYVLGPGKVFMSLILQKQALIDLTHNMRTYAVIAHSMSRREAHVRINPILPSDLG